MKLYIDSEYKCHMDNLEGDFREFEDPFFDGKCQMFIEGFRYCPEGESYVREDGEVFRGKCIVPWKPLSDLDAAQRQYERALIADMQNALNKLGVTLDE